VITQFNIDIFLLQKHWLTPANLHKFDEHFTNYFSFGCSAMSNTVESGMLRGRPFGGVICHFAKLHAQFTVVTVTALLKLMIALLLMCICIVSDLSIDSWFVKKF